MPAKTEKPKQKTAAKGKTSKNDTYACESCGLVVVVDEECGCVEAHEIICCGEPMKRTTRARATKK